MRKARLLLLALLLSLTGSFVAATPASAATAPPNCASPQFINRTPIYYGVATSVWRVGTLTQYWGWCDGGGTYNWAHMNFYDGYSALQIDIAIQTRDGRLHGKRRVESGRNFTSWKANTMCCDTRAWISGHFWNGGVATLDTQVTAWS